MVMMALAAAMLQIAAAPALLAQPGSAPLPPPPAHVVALDCAAKRMALRAAAQLQPRRDPTPIFDALQLAGQCGDTPPPARSKMERPLEMTQDGHTVWVQPGEPIQPALDRLAQQDPGRPRVLLLQGGTHFLNGSPLRLGPEHSGLTVRAAPGERPLVSGGKKLQTTWTQTTVPSGAAGAVKASLRGQNVNWTLRSVFVDGRRAIRARVPNADPEINGLHTAPNTGWFASAASWLPMPRSLADKGNASIINVSSPRRPDTGIFPFFLQGRDGPVSQFEPPIS